MQRIPSQFALAGALFGSQVSIRPGDRPARRGRFTKLWRLGGFAWLCLLINAPMLLGALNTNSSTATIKVYEAGAEKLTI